MTSVKVENLNVKINNKPILNGISFEFNTTERMLILGESGCGKSTLLLSLMGIIQRFDNSEFSGDVLIDGKSVSKIKPYEAARVFGMVFQNPESQFCSLYPEDEVAFGLENLCINPKLMDDIIYKSFEAVNFPKDRYKSEINKLSGGEQQRLALAAIFAQGAQMFLLDEPTANLDPLGRKQVVLSSKISADNGKGLLIVEHNLEPWMELIDRVIILKNDGTLLCDGKIREVFDIYGEEIQKMGIWCPYSVRIYRELKKLGYKLSKVPLSYSELTLENIPKDLLNDVINKLKHNNKEKNASDKIAMEIKDLCVEYEKSKKVLNNINLKIAKGDFFALIGSNGSGKSTLAKTLIRLAKENLGEIILFGDNTKNMKLKDICASIGYVFQNPEHQFIEDTVWSEIMYSVDQLNIDDKNKAQYVHSLLSRFELEDFKSENPFSLSLGQKRRLSVAVMLIGNQQILILDEPTFGQDEKNTYMLMDMLSELNKKGITIFMITHDIELVEEYANKTAVMYNGTIIYDDETNKLWQHKDIIEKSGLEIPFKIKAMEKEDDYAKLE